MPYPDTYIGGFYAWGVGADGFFADVAFSNRPVYDAFWFDGRTLLAPDSRWAFQPTAAMGNLSQGIADYQLAHRCQALAHAARNKGVEPTEMDRLLTEIRQAADRTRPRYRRSLLRAATAPPSLLSRWRSALVAEAAKLAEAVASHRPR